MLSPTGRAAIAYAERFGWKVFRLVPRIKVPYRGSHGHLDATSDLDVIRSWWTETPEADVALACQASGLVALDADVYKDDCEFQALEKRLGPLPHTPRQLTPAGGVHYVFKDEGGHYRNPCKGAEAKHRGYIKLAPSGDTHGRPYRWDLGALPSETPIASLPDPWLRHLTTADIATALQSSGVDAADSWLGAAFQSLGWLGGPMPDGRRMVRCPWLAEHSDGRGDGRDSSTVIFPRARGRTLGGFQCSHGHCEGRGSRAVVDTLPSNARWAADGAMRAERNRVAYEQIATVRKAVGT